MKPDTGPFSIPLFARTAEFSDRTAIIASEGTFTYRELLDAAHQIASDLLQGTGDLREARLPS